MREHSQARTQEQTIEPAATALAWWFPYENIEPGTSGQAKRMVYDLALDAWVADTTKTPRLIFDRPCGPGAVIGSLVGCQYFPTSRSWEIVQSRNWHWARLLEDLDTGETKQATVYRRAGGLWVSADWTFDVTDVQLATGETLVANARLTVEWEPYNPLPSAAPFGQWLIRTATCSAATW